MTRYALIPSVLPLFTFIFGFVFSANAAVEISKTYGKLPLHFEANQGQTHQDVRFVARGRGYGLYLTANEAVLVLAKPTADAKGKAFLHARLDDSRSAEWNALEQPDARAQAKPVALRMVLVGAAPAARVSGLEELPGKANYFIGKDPSKWRTNVPTYAKVHYQNVYPGIDLVYYGNQRQLEYDFVVAPGADPKEIVLGFKGADKLEIDAQGDLVLHAAGDDDIRLKKPIIYQEIDGIRQEVKGRYVVKSANRVGFELAAYNKSRPLIIDPVLAYSTYLGGTMFEYAGDIAVDATGNAYVTGSTVSVNFPTAGAIQPAFGGYYTDAFVAKLKTDGSALVYSTYLGGGSADWGGPIAVDAAGNALVTGTTLSTNFPTTAGAFQPAMQGPSDAFVAKLKADGSALTYSTYLGGSGNDQGDGIALDATGNAYVTGTTSSTNFPTTAWAFQPNLIGETCRRLNGYPAPCQDAFVTKLDHTGSTPVYSTYLGGGGFECGRGIAVDVMGSAYVTGLTDSTDFPTVNAVQPNPGPQLCYQTYAGEVCNRYDDAYVAKLNATGSALVYSTYLGGSGGDIPWTIAVDLARNAYVAGSTTSTDFPTANAIQPVLSGSPDAFVTKLNADGSALAYSTYLGGTGGEIAFGVTVDSAGNAYVAGSTSSANFPTVDPIQAALGGYPADAFVTKLNADGSALVYSTYLGGSGSDYARGVAVDVAGSAYVLGETNSTDFPTVNPIQATRAGGLQNDGVSQDVDTFVAKIVEVALLPRSTATSSEPSATTRFEENAASYTGRWTSYGAETGTFSGGTILASNEAGATATFSFTGSAVTWIGVKCAICGIATVSIDGGAPSVVNTTGPAGSNFTSEPVFSASGLDPGVPHTMVITITGTTTSVQAAPFGTHVAVDAFDVTQ